MAAGEAARPEPPKPKGPRIPLPSSLQEIVGALLFASESPLSANELRTCVRGVAPEEGEDAEEYDITGSTEADMNLNRISDESPVGGALIGHKAGDEVDVTLPNGSIITYKVLNVSRSN